MAMAMIYRNLCARCGVDWSILYISSARLLAMAASNKEYKLVVDASSSTPAPKPPSPCIIYFLHAIIGTIVISGAGSMMHFVYEWTDCHALAAVFCAVNESVYEHVKIMLFPMLGWWCSMALIVLDPQMFRAATCAMYTAFVVLLAGNGLSVACGFETLKYDVSLFVFCVLCGQFAGSVIHIRGSVRLVRNDAAGFVIHTRRCSGYCHLSFLLPLVVMLFTCTYFPPRWAYLFADHSSRNGTYGLPMNCSALDFPKFTK